MSDKSLTIVLPVHNGESLLRTNIERLLDLAGELTDSFSVLILDDGSTDDTFETAGELASRFPQVSVLRQSVRSGLGPAFEAIRRRVKSDVVVVYDGVSPLRVDQLRHLWHQSELQSNPCQPNLEEAMRHDMRDLADIKQVHAAMERVHRSLGGFQLISSFPPAEPVVQSIEPGNADELGHKVVRREQVRSDNVGGIPSLPQPNFLQAIAEFALGE